MWMSFMMLWFGIQFKERTANRCSVTPVSRKSTLFAAEVVAIVG